MVSGNDILAEVEEKCLARRETLDDVDAATLNEDNGLRARRDKGRSAYRDIPGVWWSYAYD